MSMPSTIEEVFDPLKDEITWLHARWIIYRQIYATSERRIDLLNRCAQGFFYIVEDVILDEVHMSLGKLTDPAKTCSSANLSLEQLQKRMEEAEGDSAFATKTRGILNKLKTTCQPFRTRRNKKLAHSDLQTVQTAFNSLPGISREMVENALKEVRSFMNEIGCHFNLAFNLQSNKKLPSPP